MKKIPILLIVLLLTIGGKLYSQGIKFNPINFEEALALAEKENKLIFIDFYTDWCAPCKGMEKNVFPDVKVGELYNKEFINLKLNGDKEGRPTVKRYGITSYPTSLFVNNKGEVVFKKVGAQNIESIIKMGKDVIASVNNIYSLIKLKELFPQKQNDEEFLKIYFTKMIEYGESPTEGIEAWLKVQTTIKEDDVDMMEFLIKHMSYLIVDGKAEEIYETNFDEYWDIATRMEEVKLKNMRLAMINNTMKMAYDQQNPELMRAFITNWKELPSESRRGNVTDFELDLLWFKNDKEAYKILATHYLDSIISAKSLEQIRIDDNEVYEAYVKKTGDRPSLLGNAIKKNLKEGKEARLQMIAIIKTGNTYLELCNKKSDYKKLNVWIDYGLKLIPTVYDMENFQAKALYKQGKVKQAIKVKESALSKLPETNKRWNSVNTELEKMKNGSEI